MFYKRIAHFPGDFNLFAYNLFFVKFRPFKSRYYLYFCENLRYFLFSETIYYNNKKCHEIFVKTRNILQNEILKNKQASQFAINSYSNGVVWFIWFCFYLRFFKNKSAIKMYHKI